MYEVSITAEELRRIPVEELREFFRDEVERTSVRVVAKLSNIGRTTLDKFVKGETNPHPRIRRLLALYYATRVRGVDSQEVSEVRLALVRITELLPPQARRDFYEQVLDTAERVYTDAGQIPPATLMQLRVWLR